jgi:hypothetical protein
MTIANKKAFENTGTHSTDSLRSVSLRLKISGEKKMNKKIIQK